MNQVITKPALRIKITGACNRTCSFCNEEGDMRTIESVRPTRDFFECVDTLMNSIRLDHVMLTGGEPTIHPELCEIITGINSSETSITTNGIRPIPEREWIMLKEAGIQRVIVSIHDATPQSFLQLETRQRQFGWALQAIEAQKHNLVAASDAGLYVRVNTVAYHSQGQVLKVLDALDGLQRKYKFEIRLLNDLTNVEQSQRIIRDVCESLEAQPMRSERRAGSSNVTVTWKTRFGFEFSTKTVFRYLFDPICEDCPIKSQCYEGFYGVRLERRLSGYYIRLCIYKHTPDILMPWETFLQNEISKQLRDLCEKEQT